MDTFTAYLEKHVLPIANKLSTQRHLHAIRDAFISLVPITLFGGIATILSSCPTVDENSNGVFARVVRFRRRQLDAAHLGNTMTLGALSVYICIGVTYFLCKHYKIDAFIPVVLSTAGFLLICFGPVELGFDAKTANILYLDGKGLLCAIFIAILTVESYHAMREHNVGRISLPPSVPASLSRPSPRSCPASSIRISIDTAIFQVFNLMGTILPAFIYTNLAPVFDATDSLGFAIIATALVQFFWFFGVHDAALSGVLGPHPRRAACRSTPPLPLPARSSRTSSPRRSGSTSSLSAAAARCWRSPSCCSAPSPSSSVPSAAWASCRAFFNISEPIIFGVPLMMNPMFFIPFLLTSTVNAIIAYLCMLTGIVAKTFALLSWNMPSIFGAYLSTFDWKAVVLVVALIAIDALIYYPFYKAYEKQLVEQEEADEATEAEAAVETA